MNKNKYANYHMVILYFCLVMRLHKQVSSVSDAGMHHIDCITVMLRMLTMLLRMTTPLTLTMMSWEHRGRGDW